MRAAQPGVEADRRGLGCRSPFGQHGINGGGGLTPGRQPDREHMIRYREAMREDATTIATLHAESWRVTYRGSYRDEFLDGPVFQDRMDVWNKRLSMPAPNQFVVLAEEEGLVVGFACAYGRDDEQWGSLLDNIHVRRQQHRQGVGTGLVSEVARWCRATYTDCGLYLWVIAQNHQARRFYERLGARDRGGELRAPSAGGGEPRDVRRYAWTAPIEIARFPT